MAPDIFYTYVWGTDPMAGRPVIFTSKANRTLALRSSKEGDLVIGVASTNPGNPNVIIPEDIKGRVVVAWQISHISADTTSYGIGVANSWDLDEAGQYRWPYAMHAFRVWFIENAPRFKDLPGYTNQTHSQRAITSIQRVEGELSGSIRDLIHSNGKPLEIIMPSNMTLRARMKLLAQKHPFARNQYTVTPDPDALYFIYAAELGKCSNIFKIGHAQNGYARVQEFNKYRLRREAQWELRVNQPIGSVEEAIEVEKHLGTVFANCRTEDNQEIFVGLKEGDVLSHLSKLSIKAKTASLG